MLYLTFDLTYTVLAALPKFLFLIFLPTILVFIHEVIFSLSDPARVSVCMSLKNSDVAVTFKWLWESYWFPASALCFPAADWPG